MAPTSIKALRRLLATKGKLEDIDVKQVSDGLRSEALGVIEAAVDVCTARAGVEYAAPLDGDEQSPESFVAVPDRRPALVGLGATLVAGFVGEGEAAEREAGDGVVVGPEVVLGDDVHAVVGGHEHEVPSGLGLAIDDDFVVVP